MKKQNLILCSMLAFASIACGSDNPIKEPVNNQPSKPEQPAPQTPSKDGQYVVLQEHTKGNGINLIFMGDAYTDEDIISGIYENDMKRFMNHTFALEPMKSLRDYFTVYMVYAASKNRNLDGNTALKTTIDSEAEQFDIAWNQVHAAVDKYAAKVPDGNSAVNTIYGVVANTSKSAGITDVPARVDGTCSDFRAYTFSTKYNEYGYDEKIVWNHELVGHAFAKLDDEYGWKSITKDELDTYKNFLKGAQSSGWSMNVSVTSDVSRSPWADLVSHYPEEKLGCYYGGNSWNTIGDDPISVYNPSWDNFGDVYYNSPSIMGNTFADNVQFNAPCRRAIYNWVMKLGEGRDATLEDFLKFENK